MLEKAFRVSELALPDEVSVKAYRGIGLVPFAIALPTGPSELADDFLAELVQAFNDLPVERVADDSNRQSVVKKAQKQPCCIGDA